MSRIGAVLQVVSYFTIFMKLLGSVCVPVQCCHRLGHTGTIFLMQGRGDGAGAGPARYESRYKPALSDISRNLSGPVSELAAHFG